jgi:hypothetical protein
VSRFKVTSIEGWSISAAAASGTKRPAPAWYVLDSANCFGIVREFRSAGNQWNRGTPEADARAYAAELERDYP